VRVYRIPYSTNVERVALALAHKGVAVDWVDVDPADRSPVVAVSGQELVPVLVDGELVLHDSPRILEHLEERHPEPPLFPRDPARREELRAFLDWFNLVWKAPPNRIVAEERRPEPDLALIEELGAQVTSSLERFERLLHDRPYPLRRRADRRRRDRVPVPQVRRPLAGGRPRPVPRGAPGAAAARRRPPAAGDLDRAHRRASSRVGKKSLRALVWCAGRETPMHPTLVQEIARYRQADMLREAERARLAHEVSTRMDKPRRRFRLRRRERPAFVPALDGR
jgi:hypothetical protein